MSKILSSYELLEALCNAFGPSGCEDAVADLIIEQLELIGYDYKRDTLGNVIVRTGNGNGKKKLMLSAHMDEVGFMVTELTDKGYLKVGTVGGISKEVIAGKHVRVGDEKGQINGIIASKAIHHKSKDERKEAEDLKKLVIDIGATSKEEALELADIGTYVTFEPNFARFGKDGKMLHSKALDDRLGCALLLELLKKLKDDKCTPILDLYFAFTVREEIGISGATVAANVIRPDYAIVLETTAVADIADVDTSKRVAALGEGGALSLMDRSTIYDKELITLALDIAKENSIKAQVKKFVSGGNDAGHIHKSGTGVRTLALSAPTRYLHSPNCVACYDDYESMLKLLYKFILTEKLN